jgi:histone deacetylase HOS3
MEEPAITANTIAEDHFRQELERHATSDASVNTVVILHDACYGHRFARPKTNKGMLSLIVERPERIQAGVMGISAAYVRLGERHEGGQHEPDPRRQLPNQLPFKICKTSRMLPLTSPAVTRVHGTKWMDELKVMCDTAGQKLATTGRETERPPDATQKNKPMLHSGDLYLSHESLAAFEGALGGVCEAVDQVFQGTLSGYGPSQAFVCVRPPGHHCSSDHPSGFCWLNNVHVGIQHAVLEHGLTHAAIIDFDLHHGDGSQSIAWDHNEKVLNMPKNKPNSSKSSIGYFSIHDINSYPCENGESSKIQNASLCIENAHNQSIWNVHLQSWKDEAEFWELYENKYMVLIDKARSFLQHHTTRLHGGGANQPQPRAAIFISAGFDASEHETPSMQRHAVNVPTDFYARFTRDIVALAQEQGTSVDGRVISVLEGGYSDKALISGVLSHVSGLCHGHNMTSKGKIKLSSMFRDLKPIKRVIIPWRFPELFARISQHVNSFYNIALGIPILTNSRHIQLSQGRNRPGISNGKHDYGTQWVAHYWTSPR